MDDRNAMVAASKLGDSGLATDLEALKRAFGRRLAPDPGATAANARTHVIRAPGRVNLIGEHTDYSEGFVFPMAIEPRVTIACRARSDGQVRLVSTVFPDEVVQFSLQEKIVPGQPSWANYCKGVAQQLVAAGIPLVGMDALLTNTLPVGGGLSSSAAVEVATGLSLLTLAGTEMEAIQLAGICHKAETEFVGLSVGIMDQTIVATGREGNAMLLDCRSRAREYAPIDPTELRVVVVNSGVEHKLAEKGHRREGTTEQDKSEYEARVRQCREGVAYFRKEDPSVLTLRDVSRQKMEAAKDALSPTVFRRCRHVVTENARATQAAALLADRRYERFGELMVESHLSLRDDYDVSIPELDFLAEEAMKVNGVYGARMTGGGFGGCIVALCQPRSVGALLSHIREAYSARYGKSPEAFATTATAGASIVE